MEPQKSPQPALLALQISFPPPTPCGGNFSTADHWRSCLQALANHSGVYEVNWVLRKQEDNECLGDLLISWRQPSQIKSFLSSATYTTLHATLTNLSAALLSPQLEIPHIPELRIRGCQGFSNEIARFYFPAQSFADGETKRALFSRRMQTYVALMRNNRRTDVGFGIHSLGLWKRMLVLLAGGGGKQEVVPRDRMLGFTGGWVKDSLQLPKEFQRKRKTNHDIDHDDSSEEGEKAVVFFAIFAWETAVTQRAAKSSCSFLAATRKGTLTSAREQWGAELQMADTDFREDGLTYGTFWPALERMAEYGVEREDCVSCEWINPN